MGRDAGGWRAKKEPIVQFLASMRNLGNDRSAFDDFRLWLIEGNGIVKKSLE